MSTLSSQLGLRLTSLCDSLEKEVVGRCVKIYRFEPHHRRKVLIIVGEITITIVVPKTGKVSKQRTEEFKKSVHLLGLTLSSNVEKVARDILTTYPYIDERMNNKLQEVIDEIKLRNYDHNGIVIVPQVAADGSFLPRYPEIFDEFEMNDGLDPGTAREVDEPDFGKLDHYVEQLYEDVSQKIEASTNISKLTKFSSYLHDIAHHESAVNALFRTLREDSKKSSQLTINILRICLDFARIKEFQSVLIKHKIPQLTLDIIDFELERCEKWKAQLNSLEETALSKPPRSRSLNEYHLMYTRLEELTNVQNSLLKVAFELLYCVSERKAVRETLLRQRVITSLVDAFDRKDNDLLEIILQYLKDLSSYKQCIEQMVFAEVIDKLAKILKGGLPLPRKVVTAALHLLYNLSFQNILRERIVKCGLVSVLTNCFEKSSFQDIAGKTLYLLSMDSNVRSKLCKSSLVITLMNQLTANQDSLPVEFGCLAVNLSRNKRCGDLMWESNRVGVLIKNGLRNEDFLAMKIVRNLAEQDAAFVLYECLTAISAAIVGSTTQEFVTECIGTLACFDACRVNVEEITQKGRIFPWLKQTLSYYVDLLEKGCSEPEVIALLKRSVIEVILLLGNLCKCEEGARLIVGEGFAELLMKILHLREKDEKIFQQILYVFNKCTEHESISVFFALKTRIPSGLLEFAQTASGVLKELCESALECIGTFDDSWKENLQQYNFLYWNKDWTDAITIEEIEQENESSRVMTGMNLEDLQNGNILYSDPMERIAMTGSLGSSDSDTEQSRWSSEVSSNDSDSVPSSFFGLFKQQFEEEMALQRSRGYRDMDFLENNFDYESESESGWV